MVRKFLHSIIVLGFLAYMTLYVVMGFPLPQWANEAVVQTQNLN